MKKMIVALVGCILVIILIVVLAVFSKSMYRFLFDTYADTTVAENVRVEHSWTRIEFTSPVRVQRKIQVIQFVFATPVPEFDATKGLRVIQKSAPEVGLIDRQGNTTVLNFEGGDSTVIEFWPNENLSPDKEYVGIRLQGPLELQISKVIWRCYDPWDRK